MLERLFDLDKQSMNGFTVFVQGERGCGKTHLVGDMLRTEQAVGKVLLINVAGEDGTYTCQGLGLGKAGVNVETWDEFIELTNELTKAPYQAIGLDSVYALYRKAVYKITGGKLPKIPTKEELKRGELNDYPEIYRLMEMVAPALRRSAKYVMATCPSDTTRDPLDLTIGITPTHIGPDLPKGAINIMWGSFDFGGIIRVSVVGKGQVKRRISFTKDNLTVGLKQRIPCEITSDIDLPASGGWTAIKTAIEKGQHAVPDA